jgi:hypothetical protein
MQTLNTFPLQINTRSNISNLKQFNDFLKICTFEFGCCCICNEKKYMHEFQIYKITNLNKNLKNMKTLFKFNPKHHSQNEVEIILKELLNNTKHMHTESQGVLLAKEGILSTEISICKSCHNCLLNNKMPKLVLVNGLWIGITPNSLPKMSIVKEVLIAHYRF